jgi:hypothetical protein
LNTVLIFSAFIMGNRAFTRQEIILYLRDPSDRPISGAEVKYVRFGYGSEGAKVFDGRGGPFHSDEQGIVRVPSRRMRHETQMTVSKGGFREIEVTLGMQFSQKAKSRNYSLSTSETKAIAGGMVPASDPVIIPLFLSPLVDAPSTDTIRLDLNSKRDLPQNGSPRSLHLKTGKFAADLSGDLELEYFSATKTRFRDQRLRIGALNGVQLFLASQSEDLPSLQTHYEQLYRIAPQSGYQKEEIIMEPGSSKKPVVYVRGADGKLYGRLCLEVLGDAIDEVPRYYGTLDINPSGRNLEWVKMDD